jgi:UPF0755 protein
VRQEGPPRRRSDAPGAPRRSDGGAPRYAEDDIYTGETVRLATVPNRQARLAAKRARDARRKRRRVFTAIAAVVLLAAVLGGGYAIYSSVFAVPDFQGEGTGAATVEVHQGDSTRVIGATLTEQGVVADPRAFVNAAADNPKVRGIQPGFYQLRLHMSGQSAVDLMLDPTSRIGQLDIRGGVQLDDTKAPDGAVTPGVLSQIAAATCRTVDGQKVCLTADDLRKAMGDTDPTALGVPDWALADVEKAEPNRRLEGLITPGVYTVEPGADAAAVLKSLVTTSASKMEAAGLVTGAKKIGGTPYGVLTLASLVEKESITADMPKVARVIWNRLGAGQRLQLDTTINYPLDVPSLYTSDANRTKPGPYNTYLNPGLPITPISAVGADALKAALAPADGPWMFFVPCQKDGTSCFAITFQDHQKNVAQARANGVF